MIPQLSPSVITALEIVPQQLYYALIWCIVAEVVYRVIPVPKRIIGIKDKKQRRKELAYLVSCLFGVIHSSIGCSLAIKALLSQGSIPLDTEDETPLLRTTIMVFLYLNI